MQQTNLFIGKMANSQLYRLGIGDEPGAYAALDFVEALRKLEEKAGRPTDGLNAHQVFSQSFARDTGKALIGEMIQRDAASRFSKAGASVARWCAPLQVTNFRAADIDRLMDSELIPLNSPGAEIQDRGELETGTEPAAIQSYAVLRSFGRQPLLNDDIQILSDLGAYAFRSTDRTQRYLAARHVLANADMSDGTAIFDSSRGNLLSGATSALDADGDALAAAMKALRTIADADGVVGVEPKILLVPGSLEKVALKLAGDLAPVSADPLRVVVEPWLEDSALGGTATNWWLLPDPAKTPVFRYLMLGKHGLKPQVEVLEQTNTDRVQIKVRLDFGMATASPLAIKSTGS